MEAGGWPAGIAHTMIGWKRLENIQQCMKDILGRNIPGDLDRDRRVARGGKEKIGAVMNA